MIAGLPGTGIGGVFYILLALWMPVRELWRRAAGHRQPEKWQIVRSQGLLTLFMLLAIWAAGWAAGWLFWALAAHTIISGVGAGNGHAGQAVRNVLRLWPVLLTLLMLIIVYAGLRVFQMVIRPNADRRQPAPPPPIGLSDSSAMLWHRVVPSQARSRQRLAKIEQALRARDHAEEVRRRLDWAGDLLRLSPSEKAHYLKLVRLERESRESFDQLWTELRLGQIREDREAA